MGKKFINPVEKARKQAKKKENNKQKKQRQEARSSNLKGKDPYLIIAELERLDKIQYNLEEPSKLNEKVIENKRRKLKDTWHRMLGMYKKEDPPRYTSLRKIEMEYDAKRTILIKKYDAINSAKEVNLEEIPLPICPNDEDVLPSQSSISQPLNATTNMNAINKSNLREPQSKFLTLNGELKADIKPPGCPSCAPPTLEELEEDVRRIRESKNAEKDLNEFLKEVDQVEKMVFKDQTSVSNDKDSNQLSTIPMKPTNVHLPPPLPPILATGQQFSKPPPPPLSHNSINAAPYPVLLDNPSIGLLNSNIAHKKTHPPMSAPMMQRPPLFCSPHPMSNVHKTPLGMQIRQPPPPPPQTGQRKDDKIATQSTIEAKPQLRNLSADVIKFLPTSLRIKRQEPIKKLPVRPHQNTRTLGITPTVEHQKTSNQPLESSQANKDTAYEQFMKELNGLI